MAGNGAEARERLSSASFAVALESGVHGYVVKPVWPSQVLITVANAGRLRCLEIERRTYQERLARRDPQP